MQESKLVEIHMDFGYYRYLPPECIGYVKGVKALYKIMQSSEVKGIGGPLTSNYVCSSSDLFRITYRDLLMEYHFNPRRIFLIADDEGRIRDYRELTYKYHKRKHYNRYRRAIQGSRSRYVSDSRKSITPEELKEIKDEYGVSMLPIKPKRSIKMYDRYKFSNISKGWKKQSKREKQWKVKG